MLKSLISEKFVNAIADKITQAVSGNLQEYQASTEEHFDKINTNIEKLRIELKSIEARLTSKELKDKTEYGHVQYQLNSLKTEIIRPLKKSDESSH